MGYETKLIIGSVSSLTSDEIERGELMLDNGEAYRPMLKDESGEYKNTGKKETWFQVVATIDLCKCGHASDIHKLDRVNTDSSGHLYWYEGDKRITEDCYGDNLKPVAISDLLTAIKTSYDEDEYRRFEWAIALLESMKDDDDLSVLLYGH